MKNMIRNFKDLDSGDVFFLTIISIGGYIFLRHYGIPAAISAGMVILLPVFLVAFLGGKHEKK